MRAAALRQPSTSEGSSPHAVAEHLPADQAHHLTSAAADPFTHALAVGFTVGGAAALVAAVAVKLFLPERHRERPAEPRARRCRRPDPTLNQPSTGSDPV